MRISICFLASHALAYGRGRPYDYIETQPWKNFLSSFNHNKKRMTDSVKKVKELPREVKKFDPFGRGKKGDAILQQAKDIGASILDPNQDFQQSIASLRADDRNLDMMMKTMKTVDFEKLLVLNRREESKKRIEVTAGKAEIEGQMEKMEQQIKDFHDDNLADLKNISTQLFSQRGMAGLQERLGRRIDDFGSDLQHLQINTEREYSKRHRGLDRYWTQLDNLVSEMPGKDMSVSAMVRTATEVGSELLSKVKAQIVGVQQKGRQVKQQVLTNLQSAQSRAQTRLDEQLGLSEKKAMEFEKDAGAATQFEKASLQTGERQMGQTEKQVQRSIAKLRSSISGSTARIEKASANLAQRANEIPDWQEVAGAVLNGQAAYRKQLREHLKAFTEKRTEVSSRFDQLLSQKDEELTLKTQRAWRDAARRYDQEMKDRDIDASTYLRTVEQSTSQEKAVLRTENSRVKKLQARAKAEGEAIAAEIGAVHTLLNNEKDELPHAMKARPAIMAAMQQMERAQKDLANLIPFLKSVEAPGLREIDMTGQDLLDELASEVETFKEMGTEGVEKAQAELSEIKATQGFSMNPRMFEPIETMSTRVGKTLKKIGKTVDKDIRGFTNKLVNLEIDAEDRKQKLKQSYADALRQMRLGAKVKARELKKNTDTAIADLRGSATTWDQDVSFGTQQIADQESNRLVDPAREIALLRSGMDMSRSAFASFVSKRLDDFKALDKRLEDVKSGGAKGRQDAIEAAKSTIKAKEKEIDTLDPPTLASISALVGDSTGSMDSVVTKLERDVKNTGSTVASAREKFDKSDEDVKDATRTTSAAVKQALKETQALNEAVLTTVLAAVKQLRSASDRQRTAAGAATAAAGAEASGVAEAVDRRLEEALAASDRAKEAAESALASAEDGLEGATRRAINEQRNAATAAARAAAAAMLAFERESGHAVDLRNDYMSESKSSGTEDVDDVNRAAAQVQTDEMARQRAAASAGSGSNRRIAGGIEAAEELLADRRSAAAASGSTVTSVEADWAKAIREVNASAQMMAAYGASAAGDLSAAAGANHSTDFGPMAATNEIEAGQIAALEEEKKTDLAGFLTSIDANGKQALEETDTVETDAVGALKTVASEVRVGTENLSAAVSGFGARKTDLEDQLNATSERLKVLAGIELGGGANASQALRIAEELMLARRERERDFAETNAEQAAFRTVVLRELKRLGVDTSGLEDLLFASEHGSDRAAVGEEAEMQGALSEAMLRAAAEKDARLSALYAEADAQIADIQNAAHLSADEKRRAILAIRADARARGNALVREQAIMKARQAELHAKLEKVLATVDNAVVKLNGTLGEERGASELHASAKDLARNVFLVSQHPFLTSSLLEAARDGGGSGAVSAEGAAAAAVEAENARLEARDAQLATEVRNLRDTVAAEKEHHMIA